jgi:hypothetical protein
MLGGCIASLFKGGLAGIWTQGLRLAKATIFHWSTSPRYLPAIY